MTSRKSGGFTFKIGFAFIGLIVLVGAWLFNSIPASLLGIGLILFQLTIAIYSILAVLATRLKSD